MSKQHIPFYTLNYVLSYVKNYTKAYMGFECIGTIYDFKLSYEKYLTEVGRLLIDKNQLAMMLVYGSDGTYFKSDLYSFKENVKANDPIQALKLIDYIEYQSTEDFTHIDSYIIHALRKRIIETLPSYDDKPWGLFGNDVSHLIRSCLENE